MTIPRELSLTEINGQYYLRSFPVTEFSAIEETSIRESNPASLDKKLTGPAKLQFSSGKPEDFTVTLSNTKGEKWIAGYEKNSNRYYIDRTASGKKDFEKGFAGKIFSKRISMDAGIDMTLIIDEASVELFADRGLTTMTSVFFPNENYNSVQIKGANGFTMDTVTLTPLKSIWKKK
jgi:fructan beta-fructosidase